MAVTADNRHEMPLGDLLSDVDSLWSGLPVTGIALDSRLLTQGDIFLACAGHDTDGRYFINEAVSRGAIAVLAEDDGNFDIPENCQGVPIIAVKELSSCVSEIAGNFYGHPSRALSLVGVTGTNGKTSSAHLLMQILSLMGEHCGVIGTLGVGVDGQFAEGINTTPDAISLQRWLAAWRDQHIERAVMEVSSHALVQGRVSALRYRAALFTNLSRDHLDYHASMADYGEAKSRLFRQPELDIAVLNLDDDFSQSLQAAVAPGVALYYYSVASADADLWLENIEYRHDGIRAILHSPWGAYPIYTPLLGEFNLSNLLGGLTVLAAMNYPLAALVSVLDQLRPVPGRMERLEGSADIDVIIDYAHTPDALEKALAALRRHTAGQLWCVFGCGGDRDRGKRGQMAAVVELLADRIVVTSDNPRSEDPQAIVDEVVAGFRRPGYHVELDRECAVNFAVGQAVAGDCVLIAGKGHEPYQIIGTQRIPFSDRAVAQQALQGRVAS